MSHRIDSRSIVPSSGDALGEPSNDVRRTVDDLLVNAVERGASDVHIDPVANGCDVKFRIDGLLERVAHHDAGVGRMLVTRLMVMAKLLTYRLDVPQEGRCAIETARSAKPIDLRVSIMPTAHGPRAAVRLPADLLQPTELNELGLSDEVLAGCRVFAAADSGMFIVTGPAGSGKTTTLYAMLRHIAQMTPGLSIVTLEDPIERDLGGGIVQIEVSPFGQLTYERALRSMLRQDPQVLMLGEIRDAATANIALGAALSGHRLLCTLHAGTPAAALVRLLDMGIEPYQLTTAVFGVVAQRLVRKLAAEGNGDGSPRYAGRTPIAEFVRVDDVVRRALLKNADISAVDEAIATQPSYRPMRAVANDLIVRNITDAAEVSRALGGDVEFRNIAGNK